MSIDEKCIITLLLFVLYNSCSFVLVPTNIVIRHEIPLQQALELNRR
jgi:hypothetical protein